MDPALLGILDVNLVNAEQLFEGIVKLFSSLLHVYLDGFQVFTTQIYSPQVFLILVDLRHLPLDGIICLQILGKGSIHLRVLFGESVPLFSRMQ